MKKAYALIYVLLFIVLLLTTVVTTWVTGMFDISLQRRTEAATQGYLLAKMGIDDGWLKYKGSSMLDSTFPRPTDLLLSYPSGACNSPPAFWRTYFDSTKLPEAKTLTPASIPSASDTWKGVYDYRIYTGNCLSLLNTGQTTIEGIGYYKGNKITLKADVTHNDREYCDGAVALTESQCETFPNSGTWKIDHSRDYLTIYQTGPS